MIAEARHCECPKPKGRVTKKNLLEYNRRRYARAVKADALLVLRACLRVWLQGFSDSIIGEVQCTIPLRR